MPHNGRIARPRFVQNLLFAQLLHLLKQKKTPEAADKPGGKRG